MAAHMDLLIRSVTEIQICMVLWEKLSFKLAISVENYSYLRIENRSVSLCVLAKFPFDLDLP